MPPVPTGIQRLLRLASVDPAFRDTLIERRGEVASAAGVPLTASEAAILGAVPAAQLLEMIVHLPPPRPARRDFLRQSAASAVVLLGGAALGASLSGCDHGASSRPTEPAAEMQTEEVEPARPESREMTNEGGSAPHLPPEPEPIAEPAEEPPPRPDRPQPTRGIRPEPPPPRPDRPQINRGVRPEPPPPRPDRPQPTRGIRPDEPHGFEAIDPWKRD